MKKLMKNILIYKKLLKYSNNFYNTIINESIPKSIKEDEKIELKKEICTKNEEPPKQQEKEEEEIIYESIETFEKSSLKEFIMKNFETQLKPNELVKINKIFEDNWIEKISDFKELTNKDGTILYSIKPKKSN
jgi:hypothetical protein